MHSLNLEWGRAVIGKSICVKDSELVYGGLLVYRLNVVRIEIPPLRERSERIASIVDRRSLHRRTQPAACDACRPARFGAPRTPGAARPAGAGPHQQLLATMVQMGLQRIIIESGRLNAVINFHIGASSAAANDRSAGAPASGPGERRPMCRARSVTCRATERRPPGAHKRTST